MTEMQNSPTLRELVTEIVSAYVSNNAVASTDLPMLIEDVHAAMQRTSEPELELEPEPIYAPQEPAIPIEELLQDDHLVCAECGEHYKSLKRHISARHELTPEQYRSKWGLDPRFPMVAPNYSASRSELAKSAGLGQQRKRKGK